MIFKRIKIHNYKTYLDLDLNLDVDNERPIILIGGMNGGGKTTLFEAICGALYGLKIKDRDNFDELLNDGAEKTMEQKIELELTFVGMVLGREQKYILRRTYILNPAGKPVESVCLNMNGNTFIYGSATPSAQKARDEQQVNKIIKANLPQELSMYFLFDAMQSSKLLEENVFAQIIRDNIQNVMGFRKYVQLKKISAEIQQEWSSQRLKAQKEKEEYDGLCEERKGNDNKIETLAQKLDDLYKTTTSLKAEYDKAKSGVDNIAHINEKIKTIEKRIGETNDKAKDYSTDLRDFVDNIENNVFLPKLASNMANDISAILKVKELVKKESTERYTAEEIADIASKVIDYLKEFALCSSSVETDSVANYIIAQQGSTKAKDEYDFINDNEMEALKNLLNTNAINQFVKLDRERQDVEEMIGNIPSLQMQKETLEKSVVNGNQDLVKMYEDKLSEIKTYEQQQSEVKQANVALDRKIHSYDVQIQQEPDIKYDTLVKLQPFFDDVADSLLKRKKEQIQNEMKEQLNKLLLSYKDCIAKVELSDNIETFSIKLYHKQGNEISLNQLNAASKQIFIQVLLKVLRNLGDYNPPVMIDTVMGVLDEESRDIMMEEYFPQLAEQTILLCTTSEIRKETDYKKLEPFISKTYTLKRNAEMQNTSLENGYFGVTLNQ
jgi:DNA sulfur modification protein DndD